ncbi:uncharacterized protein [Physcomitrium patens]|uniref:AP2/ERF domain-containing protein n=1 Tax=Physcomitrium patens TaxID=3218 RepID=A9STG4_PHYPA|nr:ethylene-responsive transcription factor ERF014-like [Physcomitrium patens]PNR53205.1 hypothetical protein PHYPA_009580 [Physcomitrium patens]|eukprot:XP_024379196.1 ethylene-responsive transcription factor ERF014-like [Physcomitrella patens]
MAARAHDAAVVCLKGPSAVELNFPSSIPPFLISQNPSSPKEIQVCALAAAAASIPQAAPLTIPSSSKGDSQVSELHVVDHATSPPLDKGPSNRVLVDYENAKAELKHSSNQFNLEDWIKGLGEMDPLAREPGKGFFFDHEMLKGVNEEDTVDLMRGFNEVERPFELVPSDDVDEELLYDVELWSFG